MNDEGGRKKERGEKERGYDERGEEERGEKGRGEDERGEDERGEKGRGEDERGEKGRGEDERGEKGRGEKGRGEDERGDKGRRGEKGRDEKGRGEYEKGEDERGEDERSEKGRGEDERGDERGEKGRGEEERSEDEISEDEISEEERTDEERNEEALRVKQNDAMRTAVSRRDVATVVSLLEQKAGFVPPRQHSQPLGIPPLRQPSSNLPCYLPYANQLATAVVCGATERVKQVIDGAPLDDPYNGIQGRWTPLMLASVFGYLDIVILLLDAGAATGLQDLYGQTALMLATYAGHPDIVAAILTTSTVSIDVQDKEGMSAIEITLSRWSKKVAGDERKFIAIAGTLIHAGANTNTINSMSCLTLLCTAVKHNIPLMTNMLVEAKADVNMRSTNSQGHLPLYSAVVNGYSKVASYLLQSKADTNSTDLVHQYPLLMVAVLGGNADVISALIEGGVSPSQQRVLCTRTAVTLVMDYVFKYPHTDGAMLQQLIDAGADLDTETRFGNALYVALFGNSYNNCRQKAEMLLKGGASLNTTTNNSNNNNKHTILYHSLFRGSESEVKLFLSYGAELTTAETKAFEERVSSLQNVHNRNIIERKVDLVDEYKRKKEAVITNVMKMSSLYPKLWKVVFSYTKIPHMAVIEKIRGKCISLYHLLFCCRCYLPFPLSVISFLTFYPFSLFSFFPFLLFPFSFLG